VINGGDAYTNSRLVTIDLTASDNLSGVSEMRFAINRTDDASFSQWQPFTPQSTLVLPNYPGPNYVNVHLRDRAGNIRRWIWDSIVLVSPSSAAAAETATLSRPDHVSLLATATVELTGDSREPIASHSAEVRQPISVQSRYSTPAATQNDRHRPVPAGNTQRVLDWTSLLPRERELESILPYLARDVSRARSGNRA
jgi:hypothetical protein